MTRSNLSQYWLKIQGTLFPFLEEKLGPLSEMQQQLISILEMIRIEKFIATFKGLVGRPKRDRKAIARSFVAKSVYKIATTRMLIERLSTDISLRRICGWEKRSDIPDESTFSRAFAEFSMTQLPHRVHEVLVKEFRGDVLVGHISRDSTEIECREKPKRSRENKESNDKKSKRKRGRPRKWEEKKKESTRLEKQLEMELDEMLEDLPKGCDIGTKKNSKGYKESWIGYKLHIDAADGCIPISCVLTSASLHDSQVAIPLSKMTNQRVTNLYDLMDSAYDSDIISKCSRNLGHVPIIDSNPRRGEKKEFDPAKAIRYNERSTVERLNGRLKDDFGGKMIRVKGNAKVMTHLMFCILALTADQLLKILLL